jgi:DNA-binding MarR family transcriptional regulator
MRNLATRAAPALSEHLLHAFLRSFGLLRQVQDPYFARFGISASQWGILRVLQRAELNGDTCLALKTVSQQLFIQPPSVTGAVDRLERQGLVKRVASTKDLRVRHLGLTRRGRDLIAGVLEKHPQRIQSLFAILQPVEQETMLNLLLRLETHLGTLITPLPESLPPGSSGAPRVVKTDPKSGG